MTSRFGTLVRQWRQRAGLSQDDLAKRAELGVRTIRGLETGERGDPRVGTLRLLADALSLTGDERAELFAAAGRTPHQPPANDPLAEATAALAHAVHARWQREEEQRQIHDPVPLPVRWEQVAAGLRDSWANIRKADPGETARPLDLAGRLDQIVDVYQRIPSRRLMVLGRAGAGKTILTMRFVLDLLATRAPADPVPVIFSVGSWHPDTTGLRDWLAEQLVRDQPGLAAPGPGGVSLATALVDAQRVLPVLDGFDEIAGGQHRAALAALNATTLPLLVTSRVDEYRAAVEATDVLTAAAAVELADLTEQDLAAYLPRTTQKTGPAGNVWAPVLAEIQRNGPLAEVLTTPLMVALARTIYSDTPDHDPAELLDTARFGTRAAIEQHLLGGFVPSVYRKHDIDRVQHWLGYLAGHLNRLGTHDLAWWQLGTSIRRRTRALVIAVGVALGIALADVVVETALLRTLDARVLTFGPIIGLVAGAAFGLAYGHLVRIQPLAPSQVRLRLRGPAAPRWPRVRVRVRIGLAFGALVGAANGFIRALVLWLAGDGYDLSIGVLVDMVAFATTFGLSAALVVGLVTAFEAPQDIHSAGSPAGLIRANRRTVLIQVVLFVPLFAGLVVATTWLAVVALRALPEGLVFGIEVAWSPLSGLAIGLVCGLGGGVGYVLSLTAWGQWAVLVRIWLPLTGRLPWTVPAFLDDAYRRGVLRRAGAVYQFRHARLQDHLSWVHRTRH